MPVCSIDAPAVSGVVLVLGLALGIAIAIPSARPSTRTTPLTAGASIEHTGIT